MDNSWMTLEPTDQQMEGDNIHKWMRLHKEDHRDPQTGEINCTGLAEECALELYPDECLPETHIVWDIAVDIAVADEEAQKAKCPHCGMTIYKVHNGMIWHTDPTAAPCEEGKHDLYIDPGVGLLPTGERIEDMD